MQGSDSNSPVGSALDNAVIEELQDQLDGARRKIATIEQYRQQDQVKLAEMTETLREVDAESGDSGLTERQVKKLKTALEKSQNRLADKDERLEQLASELGKLRSETTSLRSTLKEQEAIIRAQASTGDSPASTRKPSVKRSKTSPAKPSGKSSRNSNGATKTDPNFGQIFTRKPEHIDNLKQINGVGPALEKRLNSVGIYTFEQVSDWSKETVEYIDEQLSLGGRIRRERWVAQAKKLSR